MITEKAEPQAFDFTQEVPALINGAQSTVVPAFIQSVGVSCPDVNSASVGFTLSFSQTTKTETGVAFSLDDNPQELYGEQRVSLQFDTIPPSSGFAINGNQTFNQEINVP